MTKSIVLKDKKLIVKEVFFKESPNKLKFSAFVRLNYREGDVDATFDASITSAYVRHFGNKFSVKTQAALLKARPKKGLVATLLPKTSFVEYNKSKIDYKVVFDRGALDEWMQAASEIS